VQGPADLGDGQAAGQRGVHLGVAVPGPVRALALGWWLDGRCRLGLAGLVAQAGAVPGSGPLDRVGEVVEQVPPVGHLDCERGAAGGAFGVAAAPVAADHLHAGAAVQPRPEGVRGSFREQVDGAAGLDVHQHGAVDVAAAQREVIDAQHPRRGERRLRQGADQPQQR